MSGMNTFRGSLHRRFPAIAFVLFCSWGLVRAADPTEGAAIKFAAPSGMFMAGESLEYEVSYSVFSLGTVKIDIIDQVVKNGMSVYRAKAYMDSYSGVPFVSLHFVFYSEMAPDAYSIFFSGYDTKDPNYTPYANY
jgi:hypothetical protein